MSHPYGQHEPPIYAGGHAPYYPPPSDPSNYKHQQFPQQPQYPPPSAPPPSFMQSQSMGNNGENYNNSETNDKFNPRPKYRDLWAAILFLLHFAAFIAVSVLALRNYAAIQRGGSSDSVQKVTLNWSTIWLLLVCVGVGLVLSIIYLTFAQRFPKQFIKGTFIVSIILYWALAVYYFFAKYFSVAILTAIAAIFYTLFYFWWKPLIPFSSIMLKTVIDITKKYKSTILVAFGGLFAETLYSVWWIFTFIAAYQVWYPEACRARPGNDLPATGACESGRIVVIVIFLLFSFYWTSQVIQTWVHVTTSGVFATYYFLEGTPDGVPSMPTLRSAKRASTTSFGSICFGSLIVAILQVIRALLRTAAQESDNPFGAFCYACASVIVDMIDSLLQYFNFYAYTQVAIYGKSFRESAKDTWTLIKDRGIEAVINDNLIGTLLTMGAILVGIITALISYLYMTILKHVGSGYTPLIVFLGFIVGFQMMTIMGSIILSGNATTFVCLAENPSALSRTKPELYNAIRATYPRLAIGM
ncbi:hypothetical protein RclHR1_03630006 [Rhizophagus clarus]|uniref:Protein PNS1 n=1 Tax=Rhizophagus clarus TaxID=94130 RepID=A0A2Z6S6J3_9GLOM|nr:hypothetical protein RclHR1_03630006 [Rhizophagus clarus]GES81443.1 DUF580-domain-containing protein [Rhizophagus clarus]